MQQILNVQNDSLKVNSQCHEEMYTIHWSHQTERNKSKIKLGVTEYCCFYCVPHFRHQSRSDTKSPVSSLESRIHMKMFLNDSTAMKYIPLLQRKVFHHCAYVTSLYLIVCLPTRMLELIMGFLSAPDVRLFTKPFQRSSSFR